MKLATHFNAGLKGEWNYTSTPPYALCFASGKIYAYFYMTFSCWRTLVCEVVIRCLFVGYQAHAPD